MPANESEMLKLQIKQTFLNNVLQVLTDEKQLNDAVKSRASVRDKKTLGEAAEAFNQEGAFLEDKGIALQAPGRYSNDTFTNQYGIIDKHYSDRERLALDACITEAITRLIETPAYQPFVLFTVNPEDGDLTSEQKEAAELKVTTFRKELTSILNDVLNDFKDDIGLKNGYSINKKLQDTLKEYQERMNDELTIQQLMAGLSVLEANYVATGHSLHAKAINLLLNMANDIQSNNWLSPNAKIKEITTLITRLIDSNIKQYKNDSFIFKRKAEDIVEATNKNPKDKRVLRTLSLLLQKVYEERPKTLLEKGLVEQKFYNRIIRPITTVDSENPPKLNDPISTKRTR